MIDLISRQAAIDALCSECQGRCIPCDSYPCREVEAINALPSAEPGLDEWCTDCKEYDSGKHCCPRFNKVIRQAMKDAQPERKKGRWILVSDGYTDCVKCDKCGEVLDVEKNFCPNCGADMRGEQNG